MFMVSGIHTGRAWSDFGHPIFSDTSVKREVKRCVLWARNSENSDIQRFPSYLYAGVIRGLFYIDMSLFKHVNNKLSYMLVWWSSRTLGSHWYLTGLYYVGNSRCLGRKNIAHLTNLPYVLSSWYPRFYVASNFHIWRSSSSLIYIKHQQYDEQINECLVNAFQWNYFVILIKLYTFYYIYSIFKYIIPNPYDPYVVQGTPDFQWSYLAHLRASILNR